MPAIKVKYKDDNLGLGASLNSANLERMSAGLDAFQGLLGRLNGKDDAEAQKLAQSLEERKLAMWTRGRWGAVLFVSGGLLVQGDTYRRVRDKKELPENDAEMPMETIDTKAAKKAAKALRKAERRERKEAKLKKRTDSKVTGLLSANSNREATNLTHKDVENKQSFDRQKRNVVPSFDTDIENALSTGEKRRKIKAAKEDPNNRLKTMSCKAQHIQEEEVFADAVQLPTPHSECLKTEVPINSIQPSSRNFRHIIRRRNIEAKRMAFADAKMLDEVRRQRIIPGREFANEE